MDRPLPREAEGGLAGGGVQEAARALAAEMEGSPPRPHCGGDPAPADPVTSPLRSTQVETDAVCQGRGPETPSARPHIGPGPDGRGTGVCFEKGLN